MTDHIMELLNECSPTEFFRKVDTTFRKDSAYVKELMAALPLISHALQKSEVGYHETFGHILGRIQHIAIMSKIDIFMQTFFYLPKPWHLSYLVFKV